MKLHIILDNIRSAYNVGSIFRTADGIGCARMYICGISPDKTHPKVVKTALGSTESVPSQHFTSTRDAIKQMKQNGIPVFAVEISDQAVDYREVEYPEQVALVLGHETEGVKREILDMCDKVIFVPMHGKKESLNVATVAGIVMYEAIRKHN
jgi:tRNA G18 (ribose-2'-O)-methylase SpoU